MTIVKLKANEFNLVHGGDFKHMLAGLGMILPVGFLGVPLPLGLNRYAGISRLSSQSMVALGGNPIFVAALVAVSVVGYTELSYGAGDILDKALPKTCSNVSNAYNWAYNKISNH